MLPQVESIDELLARCEPRVRRLAEAARKRILVVVPEATEKLRPGWSLIGYNAPAYFAFILPTRYQVRIGFEWGVMLPDPKGLLEGDGSQVRYFTLGTAAALRSPELSAFLRAAAAIRPPPRQTRRRAR
jgi:hypothetical protein